MGCGSSTITAETPAQANNNAVPNGNAKQDTHPSPNKDRSPKLSRRKSSASSSDSSGSSRSSVRSQEKKNTEKVEEQKPVEKETEKPQESATDPQPEVKENDTEKEIEKEKEDAQEQENEKTDETDGQEKPKFTEEALKSFVELESEIKDLESKNQEGIIQNEYQRLLELHKTIEDQVKKVEELKQQT